MKPLLNLKALGRCALAAGSLLAGPALSHCMAADPLVVTAASRPTEWTVSFQNRPVFVCASDPRQFKPYVRALYTVGGRGVLRDAPFDHLHHHALMYGIRVNGLNFWEETSGCGVQRVVETLGPDLGTTGTGLPEARLTQVIHWLAPGDAFLPDTNAAPLLIERRTLRLVINAKAEETALYWNSRFEVGPATNTVTLSGANYHGLGMRFLKELDGVAAHLTPEGQPDLSGGRQDVSAHSWEAVVFDTPDQPATIAIFGHPSNARGQPVFFAMHTPFAYLAATQGLDKEPLVRRRGETFELNYLVTLHAGRKSADTLTAIARDWVSGRR